MAKEIIVISLYDEDLRPLASIPLKRCVLERDAAIKRLAKAIKRADAWGPQVQAVAALDELLTENANK